MTVLYQSGGDAGKWKPMAADKSDQPPRNERPRLLSSATTKVLKSIAKMFEQAPVIDTPMGPEALSSL